MDFEMSVDQIAEVLGSEEKTDFMRVMKQVQGILDNPEDYHGVKALKLATELAALRTRISIRAQYYKTAEKRAINTQRKNLLLAMYAALEENINTLKLLGKVEARV